MESTIVDVQKLVAELGAKVKQIDACVAKIDEAKKQKDVEGAKAAEEALEVLEADFTALEAQVDKAKKHQARQDIIKECESLSQPAPAPLGKDMGVPGGKAPATARDHEAEENVKRSAFFDWMRGKEGTLSDSKRDLIQVKSKSLLDASNAKHDAGTASIPMTLLHAMVGPYIASALGAPLGGKVMMATSNATTNPSFTNLLLNNQFVSTLQRLPFAEPVWLPKVSILPTSSGTSTILPALTQTDTNTGSGEFGGVAFSWISEAATKPDTEPTFEQITITAYELAGYTEVSQRALNRSEIALEAFLRLIFSAAFEYELERVILNGTGTGQPAGIIPFAGVRNVARQTAGTVGYTDFVNLKHAVRSYHRGGARFIMHDNVERQNERTVDSQGHPIFNATVAGGVYDRVIGYPKDVSYNCAALGSDGDTIYGNPAWYTLTVEEEFAVARSEHYSFRNDRVAYRVYGVVGGRPMLPRAFAILTASTS